MLRLSLPPPLLDDSPVIRVEHLRAALALWKYAEQSARWIFGGSPRDPIADTIVQALRKRGPVTREAIYRDVFHGHVKTARIARALARLVESGLARCQREQTAGRPVTIWRAI